MIFLILFTTLVSYGASLLISKYNNSKKLKITFLTSALVLCFGVLIFFKYVPFFYDVYADIAKCFNPDFKKGVLSIILPVGISFYTFQTASYVIDVYKGKFPAEKHLGYYALFVTYFPQLVAGPIERPGDLLPQLKADKKITDVKYKDAFRIMLVGFFKKIAIADIIGIIVNNVYQSVGDANGLTALIATVLFAFQILCDFSGYSDIAVGCSKLFGVDLTENFNSPYTSKSIKEFWGRWHITLSSWLRDYIYIPIGGSKKGIWRWILAVMTVFFVSGLWHGANYTFIIWGLAFGVLTLKYRNKAWEKLKVNPTGKVVSILRIVGTFIMVDLLWIFFRSNNIQDAGTIFVKIFSDWGNMRNAIAAMGFNLHKAIYIPIAIVSTFFIDYLKNMHKHECKLFTNDYVRIVVYGLLIGVTACAWFYLQSSNIGSSFIYFQF